MNWQAFFATLGFVATLGALVGLGVWRICWLADHKTMKRFCLEFGGVIVCGVLVGAVVSGLEKPTQACTATERVTVNRGVLTSALSQTANVSGKSPASDDQNSTVSAVSLKIPGGA